MHRRRFLARFSWLSLASAGAGAASENRTVLGVWRATEGDLPLLTMTLTDEGGSLAGAILFYLIRREPGQPVTASPGIPEPLLHPKWDGRSLTFQVSHRRAHPPRTLSDPPVSMRLQWTGPNEGLLLVEGGKAPAVQVTRNR